MRKRRKTLAMLLLSAMLVSLTAFNLLAASVYATEGENDLTPPENTSATEGTSSSDTTSTEDESSDTVLIAEEEKEPSSDLTETNPDSETPITETPITEEKEEGETPQVQDAEAPKAPESIAPPAIMANENSMPTLFPPFYPGRYIPTYYAPANFYILNGVDPVIPQEPGGHAADGYSSGIYKADALALSYNTYTTVIADGSCDSLADDNFTANNAVLSSLHSYPSAEDIKEVVPSFDPETQYVVWYVKKLCSGSGIHVDGAIRSRVAKGDEGEEIIESPENCPNVSIEITTTCEGGDFEYDGKEHVIGGFSIVVRDLDENKHSLRHLFSALGDLLTIEACAAADGEGTYFSHGGIRYWVNIDSAYVVAKEIQSYTIPFIFDGKEISADDIVVKYEKNGKFISLPSSVVMPQKPSTVNVNVKQRSITLEAGTTVKNYDGSTITNDTVKISSGSLMEGHKLVNVVINGSQSAVGSSKNEITSYKIVDENGKDVTNLYNVKCVNGKLELVGKEDGSDDSASADASLYGTTTVVKSVQKNDAEPTVLGATKNAYKKPRMGQTGDETRIASRLIVMIVCCVLSVLLSRKKAEK